MHHSLRLRLRLRMALVLALPLLGLSACSTAMQALASPGDALLRAISGCGQIQPYEMGTKVSGEFTASDCYIVNGEDHEPLDYYEFTTSKAQDVYAVVEAPGLNVELTLQDPSGVKIKTDPYVGDFTFISTQVPAGTYRWVLRSQGSAMQPRLYGRYTLRSSTDEVGFEGCPDLADVALGSTVQGEWSVTDCTQAINSRYTVRPFDAYRLVVPATKDVQLTLASPGIESTIALFTRDAVPLKQADAFGSPAEISTQLAPGTYIVRVGVSGVSDRETGPYTLQVR